MAKETGGGAVITKTIMVFQEMSDHVVSTKCKISASQKLGKGM